MVYRKVWIHALTILLGMAVLALSACGDDGPGPDFSIGEITINNIPAKIPVNDNHDDPVKSNDTFKVYLNASDFQEADKPPKAQGVVKVTTAMLKNGKYSVTIPLKKPASSGSKNPNEDDGPWEGTAVNFSLMIVPEDVKVDGVNAIWVKGGLILDKSRALINWDSNSELMNFRDPLLAGPPYNLPERTQALFDGVVCKDPDITSE